MEKKEKYNKKNLKKRLSAILTIYLDGLSDKKRKKMDKYLDSKLGYVVEYYVGLLNKKKKKNRVLPPLTSDLIIQASPSQEIEKEETKIEEQQMQEELKDSSGLNSHKPEASEQLLQATEKHIM
jgi:hypothetical protein